MMPTVDVLGLFNKLSRQHLALKQQAEAQVHCWRWATEDMLEVLPLQALRQGDKPGRWLDQPPRNKANHTRHGLDRDGRVVAMHSWGPSRNDCTEHFVLRDGDTVRHTRFNDWEGSGRTQLLACTVLHFERGRAAAAVSYCKLDSRVRREKYFYEGAKLVRIDTLVEQFPGRGAQTNVAYHEDLVCDDLGRLDRIVAVYPVGSPVYPRGRSLPVYSRPKRKETLASLGEVVEALLLERIPRAVAAANVRQPIFALVLGYGPENPLPPVLGLGLESERRQWAKQHGADAGQVLWNPEEYAHTLRPGHEWGDPELVKACDLLNLLIRQKRKYEAAPQLLNRVAARLMERDWSGCLKPTADFVVVASDIDGQVEVPANLRASAGPGVLETFKARGWV